MLLRRLAPLALLVLASPPVRGAVRYVAVGDSITEGTGDETLAGGYPPRLRALLVNSGLDAIVDNRGIGGETSAGALNRIDNVLTAGGDVILLMEGTNDISRHFSPETTLFNLEEIARRSEAKGLGVVHSTLIPRLPDARVDPNNRANELIGGMIRQMSWDRERPFADPYRDFLLLPQLFVSYYWDDDSDPVGHPNAAGYDELAESFLQPSLSPCFTGEGILASFDLSTQEGEAPLSVEFTDTSPVAAVTWEWDFQDDGEVDSTEQHPTFVFEEEGLYSVRLRISNGQCTATRLLSEVVSVLPRAPTPSDLTATAVSATAIELHWTDPADDETHFLVEGRARTGDFETYDLLPADTTSVLVDGLDERTYYAFRVRSGNLEGVSEFSNVAAATTLGVPAPCSFSDEEVCLADGRLAATVEWKDHLENRGVGHASQLSEDTGVFWFFDDANLELVVKGLDGSPVNGHYWTFYGSLTDVAFVLTVMDTESGATRSYVNGEGQFASVGDTESFPAGAPAANVPEGLGGIEASGVEPCDDDPQQLCLRDDRFAVRVDWKSFQGVEGVGTAVPATSDTGFFWFFDDANVELAIKVLDGRPINGNFWVFFGALSNVEYTVTVVDRETGAERVYFNPSGTFASFGDTEAFPPVEP